MRHEWVDPIDERSATTKFFMNERDSTRRPGSVFAWPGRGEPFYSPPERAKPKTERERCRRVIRIRPVVVRPRVVIGIRPVVRAIITAVVAARTEIGGIGCARRLRLRLRRRRCRRPRSRNAKRQYRRNSSRSNQRLHGSLLLTALN